MILLHRQRQALLFLPQLLLLLQFLWISESYRVGDNIDTVVWTNKQSSSIQAIRNQMPRFGITTKTSFEELLNFEEEDDNRNISPQRFSISFEEGLRALPWVSLYDGYNNPLEKFIVTFVYSKSGDGAIHSITSEPIYAKRSDDSAKNNNKIIVQYKWVEEEIVDISFGNITMFLIVLAASWYFVFEACGFADIFSDEDSSSPTNDEWQQKQNSSERMASYDYGTQNYDYDYSQNTTTTTATHVMSGGAQPKWE